MDLSVPLLSSCPVLPATVFLLKNDIILIIRNLLFPLRSNKWNPGRQKIARKTGK